MHCPVWTPADVTRDLATQQKLYPGDAGAVVREPVLCAAWPVLPADRVPLRPEGHSRGHPAILSRAPRRMTLHVVVIGAGIVGAACAIELLRDGHRVTILEPGEPGGEQAASYGNGTLLNPSSVIPMSSPGHLEQGARLPGRSAWPAGDPLALSAAPAALAAALPARRLHTEAKVARPPARCARCCRCAGRGIAGWPRRRASAI